MPNINREFVEKLDIFTDALGDVVELLKNQSDKGTTDSVNLMLDNIPDKLTQIVEELKLVKEDIKSLKTTTDDIKKTVDDIKKSKESGLFGKISDGNNKEKIKQGVAIIGLIAGGVLAIGLAFKIIGDVNFGTVLSLSIAVVTLTWSFTKVYKTLKDEKVSYTDIIKISSILPIMSLGLLSSSFLLSFIPTISITQSLSILIVSSALGMSLFLISKALKLAKMNNKTIGEFLLLPIILPAIAAGVLSSAYILKEMPSLGFMQMISLVFVSGALGVSLFLMSKALSAAKMDNKTISQFLLLPLILPAIATGIWLSSLILKHVPQFSFMEALNIGLVSLAIGIGTLAMLPTLIAVGKFNLKWEDITKSGVAIVGLSAIIVASAFILQEGSELIGGFDSSKVPSYDWSLKVGLSLVAFGGSMFILSKIPKDALINGGLATLALSGIIWASSWILSEGNYDNAPPLDWVSSVGLSMLVFGGAAVGLGLLLSASGGIGYIALAAGAVGVLGITGLMIGVDKILENGKWEKYPSLEWSKSVGLSLMAFSLAMITSAPGAVLNGIFKLFGSDPPINQIAKQMVDIADVLNEYDWNNTKYPSLEWSKGVGEALSSFASMSLISGDYRLMDSVIGFFTGDKKSSIETLADQMINVAKAMDDPIWDTNLKYPKPKWSEGVGGALFAFANTFKILDDVDIDNDDFKKESILLISGLKSVATHMEGQKWDNLPDTSGIKTWADGVTDGVSSFIEILNKIDKSSYGRSDRKGMNYIFESMVLAHLKLNGLKFSKIDGLKEWTDSLSNSVPIFIDLISKIDKANYQKGDRVGLEKLFESIVNISKDLKDLKPIPKAFYESFSDFALSISKIPSSLYLKSDILSSSIEKLSNLKVSDNITNLASSIRDLSDSLNTLNPDAINKLNGFTGSMLVMSVVDSAKLEEFIKVLDDKKEDLSDIISMGNMNQPFQNQIPIVNVMTNNNSLSNQNNDNERFEKLMKKLETMSEYLSRMLEIEHISGVDKFTHKDTNY